MKNYQRLIYQANAAPSGVAKLFLIFNTWQTIFTLNTLDAATAGIRIMEVIMINILLSFLVFIAAFEIKRYNLRWSRAALVIGIIQCLRCFFIPDGPFFARINILVPLEAAGFFLILASVWSISKCRKYRQAQRELPCLT
ncbi:MAG: hypothetical protein LBB72_04525 [Spirochaetaceae bacterium]|jgi:hypothetical protein|nr:hypothetical protein [Spirochaetaceae bacterium]